MEFAPATLFAAEVATVGTLVTEAPEQIEGLGFQQDNVESTEAGAARRRDAGARAGRRIAGNPRPGDPLPLPPRGTRQALLDGVGRFSSMRMGC